MTADESIRGLRVLDDEALSEGLTTLLTRYLRVGLTVELACRGASINPKKFYRWMRYGDDEDPEYKGPGSKYETFRLSIDQAMLHAAETAMNAWNSAIADGDWKAASRFMAQRFPEDFSERRVSKPDSVAPGQITVNIQARPGTVLVEPEEDPITSAIDDILSDAPTVPEEVP